MSGFVRTVGEFAEIIEPLSDDEDNPSWGAFDDSAFPALDDISLVSNRLPPIPSDAPRLLDSNVRAHRTVSPVQRVLQQEEAALGAWPRRLLHVPSLTSYEWQPGNVYGGVSQPMYNCITYTWGRWKLADTDQRTEALPVKNVPWKIPKVDPSHFTVAEFIKALSTGLLSVTKPSASWQKYERVDFLWLDVACICQDADDPRSAAEIGRQAKVFRNAQAVFIWLTTFEKAGLTRLLTALYRDVESHEQKERPSLVPATVQRAYEAMRTLLKDWWFSSLWTLQEAFLRSDALLMTRDGHVVHLERRPLTLPDREPIQYRTPVDLVEVLDYTQPLRSLPRECCSHPSATKAIISQMEELHAKILHLVRSRGLLALYTTSPLSTFTAASSRKTTRHTDRIYAIQQVFDFRLGISSIENQSAIPPAPDGSYGLPQLQDQLGEFLMTTYPIHSQMHVYTDFVDVGKGWRVNETSVVPGSEEGTEQFWQEAEKQYPNAPYTWPDDLEEGRKLCRLDVAFVDGDIWGQFEARLCPFAAFHRKLQVYEADCIMTKTYEANSEITFLQIWPDVTEELAAWPGYKGKGYHPIPQTCQRAFAAWLVGRFWEDELMIMILGLETIMDNHGGGNTMALLVVNKTTGHGQYWHRLGICRWMSSELTTLGRAHPMRPFFQGLTGEWSLMRGLLG